MQKIGCHLSVAKGLVETLKVAKEINANTFQFFSRNPRGSSLKKYTSEQVEEFKKLRKKYNIGPILAHAPYTMNLASTKEATYEFAKNTLKQDLRRMDDIGIEYLNIHPGSHVGEGLDLGIEKISIAINEAIEKDQEIMLLLEAMSGKGTEVGYRFEQLQQIIDKIDIKEKIGICIDTCHIFAAGYDIVNNLDGVLNEFDKIIGIQKLKAIHLNDSMMPFASKKDRHAKIGEGKIGFDAIINIITHPMLNDLPFYLETPLDTAGRKEEIEDIRKSLKKNNK